MWGGFGLGIWAVKANVGDECGHGRGDESQHGRGFGLGLNTSDGSSMRRAVQRRSTDSFFHLLFESVCTESCCPYRT